VKTEDYMISFILERIMMGKIKRKIENNWKENLEFINFEIKEIIDHSFTRIHSQLL